MDSFVTAQGSPGVLLESSLVISPAPQPESGDLSPQMVLHQPQVVIERAVSDSVIQRAVSDISPYRLDDSKLSPGLDRVHPDDIRNPLSGNAESPSSPERRSMESGGDLEDAWRWNRSSWEVGRSSWAGMPLEYPMARLTGQCTKVSDPNVSVDMDHPPNPPSPPARNHRSPSLFHLFPIALNRQVSRSLKNTPTPPPGERSSPVAESVLPPVIGLSTTPARRYIKTSSLQTEVQRAPLPPELEGEPTRSSSLPDLSPPESNGGGGVFSRGEAAGRPESAQESPRGAGAGRYFGGHARPEEAMQEDSDTGASTATSLGLYVRTGWVVGLTLVDSAAAVVLQLLWESGDFLCHRSPGRAPALEIGNLVWVCAIVLAHVAYLAGRVRRHRGGERPARRLAGLLATHVEATWHLLVLALSAVMLAVHAHLCLQDAPEGSGVRTVQRLQLAVHLLRVQVGVAASIRLRRHLRRRLQRAVSQQKRRFVDKKVNLDLDLTYITDRLIGMSLPCVDDAPYRNDIKEVSRFFAARHYGSFVVINLSEAHEEAGNGNYDIGLLYGQVQKLPMRDHNAPCLYSLVAFCERAAAWLNRRRANVVAVHCQGGKGRTGLFCASLLLWVGFSHSAQEALDYVGRRRTEPSTPVAEQARVVSPSQIRYLGYIETLLSQGTPVWQRAPLLLHGLSIHRPPRAELWLSVIVEEEQRVVYDHCKQQGPLSTAVDNPSCFLHIPFSDLLIQGDVTVRIYRLDLDPGQRLPEGTAGELLNAGRSVRYGSVKGKALAFVSLHTAFHSDSVSLDKWQVDGSHKDPLHSLFDHDFRIDLLLSRPPPPLPLSQSPETHNPPPVPAPRRPPSLLLHQSISSPGVHTPHGPVFPVSSDLSFEGEAVAPEEQSAEHRMGLRDMAARLDDELHRVVLRHARREHEFRAGEVILDSGRREKGAGGGDGLAQEAGLLYYLRSGRVEMERGGKEGKGVRGALGLEDMAYTGLVLEGAVLGVENCVAWGANRRPPGGGVVYRARSDTVKVASVRLGTLGRKKGERREERRLTGYELLVLYAAIAAHLSRRSAALANQLAYIKNLANAKVDFAYQRSQAYRSKLHKRIVATHSLPPSEKVVLSCEGTMHHPAKLQGDLVLFSNWLVFAPVGADDLLLPLSAVERTFVRREALVIVQDQFRSRTSSTDNEQPPPSPSNTNSLFRKASSRAARSRKNSERPASRVGSMVGSSLGGWYRSGTFGGSNRRGSMEAARGEGPQLRRGSSEGGVDLKQLKQRLRSWRSKDGDKDKEGGGGGKKKTEAELWFSVEGEGSGAVQRKLERQIRRMAEREGKAVEGAQRRLVPGAEDGEGVARQLRLVLEGEELPEEEHRAMTALLRRCPRRRPAPLLPPVPLPPPVLTRTGRGSWDKGSVVVRQGESGEALSFILAGQVVARLRGAAKSDEDGVVVWHSREESEGATQVLGEACLLHRGNAGSPVDVVAETDLDVLQVPLQALEAEVQAHPSMLARFCRCLALALGQRVEGQEADMAEEAQMSPYMSWDY